MIVVITSRSILSFWAESDDMKIILHLSFIYVYILCSIGLQKHLAMHLQIYLNFALDTFFINVYK